MISMIYYYNNKVTIETVCMAKSEITQISQNSQDHIYCKSTIFGRYKIWWIYYFLGDNRGFSLYNPI